MQEKHGYRAFFPTETYNTLRSVSETSGVSINKIIVASVQSTLDEEPKKPQWILDAIEKLGGSE